MLPTRIKIEAIKAIGAIASAYFLKGMASAAGTLFVKNLYDGHRQRKANKNN